MRELENSRRAAAASSARGKRIDLRDLATVVPEPLPEAMAGLAAEIVPLRVLTRRYVEWVLEQTGGNKVARRAAPRHRRLDDLSHAARATTGVTTGQTRKEAVAGLVTRTKRERAAEECVKLPSIVDLVGTTLAVARGPMRPALRLAVLVVFAFVFTACGHSPAGGFRRRRQRRRRGLSVVGERGARARRHRSRAGAGRERNGTWA